MPPVRPQEMNDAGPQFDVASGMIETGHAAAAQQNDYAAAPERDQHRLQAEIEPLKHLFGGEPVTFIYTMNEHRQLCEPSCTFDSAAIISNNISTQRHIVRTRYNISGCPTSMTEAVADRLGLARVSLGGGGCRCPLSFSQEIPLQMLVDPLDIKLMRSHDDVALTWKAPVVFVVPGASSFWEFQLGFDFHQVINAPLQFSDPGTLIRRLPSTDSGHIGGSPHAPPFLVPYIAPKPNQERVFGSSTIHVTDATWQQAMEIASAREGAWAHRASEIGSCLVMCVAAKPVTIGGFNLVAKPWPEVEDEHLPIDNHTCAICMEDMKNTHEQQQALAATGDERQPLRQLFVQLRCRHTFCELCLQSYLSASTARGDNNIKKCPTCMAQLIG